MPTTAQGAAASATIAALLLTTLAAGPAVAAESDMEVVGVVVSGDADVGDGFGVLTVDLALRSGSGLPDGLSSGVMGGDDVVYAQRVGGEPPPWLAMGEFPPTRVGWIEFNRVSGTGNDGVWRGTTEVSRYHGGTWQITKVRDYGVPGYTYVDVSDLGVTFEIGDSAPPPWVVAPVFTEPVKVVTGTESWIPRARVTARATGTGVAAFYDTSTPWWDLPTPVHVPPRTWNARADAQGYLTFAPRRVGGEGDSDRFSVHVYSSWGSSGYALENGTALWPYVKWQANERFATSGRTITASGNAWPAPAIYRAENPTIHLQQMVGRTWRTVASSTVRDNGRYTIVWTAPARGTHVVRVYKPGGSQRNGIIRSAGTTLPAVELTTR